MPDLTTMLSVFLQQLYAGTISFTGQGLAGDGTSSLPAYSFTSEPTLGFWRSGANTITATGAFSITGGNLTVSNGIFMPAAGTLAWTSRLQQTAPADGNLKITNYAATIGSQLKVDALPSIFSGFGGSPAVTAGSTAFAGSVDVGTGGAATTGVVQWAGTAFPSAPFVVCTCSLGSVPTIAVGTTTGVTFTTSVAWPANTKISWIAVSSK